MTAPPQTCHFLWQIIWFIRSCAPSSLAICYLKCKSARLWRIFRSECWKDSFSRMLSIQTAGLHWQQSDHWTLPFLPRPRGIVQWQLNLQIANYVFLKKWNWEKHFFLFVYFHALGFWLCRGTRCFAFGVFSVVVFTASGFFFKKNIQQNCQHHCGILIPKLRNLAPCKLVKTNSVI